MDVHTSLLEWLVTVTSLSLKLYIPCQILNSKLRHALLYLEFSMLAVCVDQFYARLQPVNIKKQEYFLKKCSSFVVWQQMGNNVWGGCANRMLFTITQSCYCLDKIRWSDISLDVSDYVHIVHKMRVRPIQYIHVANEYKNVYVKACHKILYEIKS